MKKGFKIFIVVVLLVLLCGCGYLAYDKFIKKAEDSEPLLNPSSSQPSQVVTIKGKEYKASYVVSNKKVEDVVSDLDVSKDRYNGVLDISLNGNYITSIPFVFEDYDGTPVDLSNEISILSHQFATDDVLIQVEHKTDRRFGNCNFETGNFIIVTTNGEVLDTIQWKTSTCFQDKETGKFLIYEINTDSLIIYEPVYGNDTNGVLALKQQYTVNNGTVVKTTLKNLTDADVDASGK